MIEALKADDGGSGVTILIEGMKICGIPEGDGSRVKLRCRILLCCRT